MSEPVQTSQPTVLEVPVTIQGSQIVPGTDRRELFTETTKTTLTMEKGCVVNLKARVTLGQSLFLRNELSGREILCRVLETPAEDKSGYTDLEFTVHDPEFWSVYERSSSAAGSSAQDGNHDAREAGVATAPEAAQPERQLPGFSEDPTPPLQPVPEPEPNKAPATAAPETHQVEVDDAKDAERLAGIIARTARRMAKMAAAKEAAEASQDSASSPQGDATPRKQKAFSTLAFRLHGLRELTVKKNPIAFGIATVIVLAAAAGVAWDVRSMLVPASPRAAASVHMKPTAHPSPSASQAASTGSGTTAAVSGSPASKIQPSSVAQVPAARIEKARVPAAADVRPTLGGRPIIPSRSSDGFTVVAAPPAVVPPLRAAPLPMVPEAVPARIISQFQPSLPKWAKDLDLGGTVQLDAVIDANGDLGVMRLVSGPRVLESSAEAAVELWLFAPATSGGRPVPSHMLLTVEFQR